MADTNYFSTTNGTLDVTLKDSKPPYVFIRSQIGTGTLSSPTRVAANTGVCSVQLSNLLTTQQLGLLESAQTVNIQVGLNKDGESKTWSDAQTIKLCHYSTPPTFSPITTYNKQSKELVLAPTPTSPVGIREVKYNIDDGKGWVGLTIDSLTKIYQHKFSVNNLKLPNGIKVLAIDDLGNQSDGKQIAKLPADLFNVSLTPPSIRLSTQNAVTVTVTVPEDIKGFTPPAFVPQVTWPATWLINNSSLSEHSVSATIFEPNVDLVNNPISDLTVTLKSDHIAATALHLTPPVKYMYPDPVFTLTPVTVRHVGPVVLKGEFTTLPTHPEQIQYKWKSTTQRAWANATVERHGTELTLTLDGSRFTNGADETITVQTSYPNSPGSLAEQSITTHIDNSKVSIESLMLVVSGSELHLTGSLKVPKANTHNKVTAAIDWAGQGLFNTKVTVTPNVQHSDRATLSAVTRFDAIADYLTPIVRASTVSSDQTEQAVSLLSAKGLIDIETANPVTSTYANGVFAFEIPFIINAGLKQLSIRGWFATEGTFSVEKGTQFVAATPTVTGEMTTVLNPAWRATKTRNTQIMSCTHVARGKYRLKVALTTVKPAASQRFTIELFDPETNPTAFIKQTSYTVTVTPPKQ